MKHVSALNNIADKLEKHDCAHLKLIVIKTKEYLNKHKESPSNKLDKIVRIMMDQNSKIANQIRK